MVSIDIEHLLHRTADILQSQREHRATTGEGYNFFTALCAFHDENRHSRFLHSLLNPRGAHGQGALFLRLFLIELGVVSEAAVHAWRLDQWHVETEVTFADSGRRIDLLLQGKEALVGIENKVFADEGKEQLCSYAQSLHLLHAGRPATLVFLTPSGRDPESSAALSGVELVCCGYGHQASPSLFHWLDACRKAVADKPRLVEVMQQYAEVVDRTGGNTMKKQALQPLVNLLQSRRHFEAATALVEVLAEAKVQAQVAFWRDLHPRLLQPGEQGAPTLLDWPHAGATPPDDKVVRGCYGTRRERPNPCLCYDTGLRWSGHALVLALELLAKDSSRSNLTWKFQLRDAHDPGKAKRLPDDGVLSKVLCALDARHLKATPWSLASGDLVLPDGTRLDVTEFKDELALKWLDADTRPQVLDAVSRAVENLVRRAGEAIDAITASPPR